MKKRKDFLVLNYSSFYAGNFISSIDCLLEKLIVDDKVFVSLPIKAQNRVWCKRLVKKYENIIDFSFINFDDSKLIVFNKIKKIISREKIDLIHFHFYYNVFFNIYSVFNREFNIFFHLHSDFSLGKTNFKTRIKNFMKFKLLRGRVNYISVGKYLCKENKKHIKYISNALAPRELFYKSEENVDIRELYNIPKDEIVFEIYGWSPNVKGVDLAVNAIKEVREKYKKKINLAIICGETVNQSEMKKFILKNTNCTGDEDYLYFLKPQDNVFEFHNSFDILLSPSRSEAFSYVLLEMLSLGKRCIISNIPGQSWSTVYETVETFETNDYEDLAKKINEILGKNLKNNCKVKKQIEQDYSIKKWIDNIIQTYNEKNK